MARCYYFLITLQRAKALTNVKRGQHDQSPMVVFQINPGGEPVLSRRAMNGGVNPKWGQKLTLHCHECDYQNATLTMDVYHVGKKYDKFLGEVPNFPVRDLETKTHELTVRSEGQPAGELVFYVRTVPPPAVWASPPRLRSIEVCVHRARGLKNVKPLWKRVSLSDQCVRKMRPYVVAKNNLSLNEPKGISPVAERGGKDPQFDFYWTFQCEEALLDKEINRHRMFSLELRHRHKFEINRGFSGWELQKDLLIGTVEDIMVSKFDMERGAQEYDVRTPEGKSCGTVIVSVTLGKLGQQEQEYWTSPCSPSWTPRTQSSQRGAIDTLGRIALVALKFGAIFGGVDLN